MCLFYKVVCKCEYATQSAEMYFGFYDMRCAVNPMSFFNSAFNPGGYFDPGPNRSKPMEQVV